ncbi:MAG: sugar transferase [Coriobacteriia bacterium]|nr:sugar transferase [Coriobacteriia bacterium]
MSRLRFRLFSLFADAFFVNAAVIVAFLIRFMGQIPPGNLDAYLTLMPLLTLAYLTCGWLYNLYEPEQLDSPWATTSRVFPAAILGTLGLTAIAFLGGEGTAAFPRLTLPIILILSIAFLLGWRLLFLRFGKINWPEQRTLIIGHGGIAHDLATSIQERTKWGWKLVGIIPSSYGQQRINQIIVDSRVNRIIVADPAQLREFVEQLVLAEHAKLTVDVVPELYETFIGQTHTIIGDIPLMRIVSGNIPRYQRLLKRSVDLFGALILATVAAPIMFFAALLILLSDGRPLFYKQKRVGRNQSLFWIFKFRTMVKNAEELSGPVLATEDDPRITPVGRRLRKFRIDELPQVINIMRGEMSFIGPRPERPEFVSQYLQEIPGYSERFRIKPGVTGLAQTNGGYATTPDRKLKYDLMYLYHQSLMLDAQIMVETVKVILSGRGAR